MRRVIKQTPDKTSSFAVRRNLAHFPDKGKPIALCGLIAADHSLKTQADCRDDLATQVMNRAISTIKHTMLIKELLSIPPNYTTGACNISQLAS